MPARVLVVLEDGLLRSMAADLRFTREFPFLAGLKTSTRSGCGRCGRRVREAQAPALDAARRTLAGLPTEKKKKLLQLLNTQQVRLRYHDGTRVVVKTLRADAQADSSS